MMENILDNLTDGKVRLMDAAHNKSVLMAKIPFFTCRQLNSIWENQPFPAFVGPNEEIYDSIYISIYQFPLQTRTEVDRNVSLEEARAKARALGGSYHLLTAWEWSAMAWYFRTDLFWRNPRGYTEVSAPKMNGHGSFMYRVPQAWYGVWGIAGNLYEYCDGIEFRGDRLWGTPTNDWSKNNKSMSKNHDHWVELGRAENADGYANKKLDEVNLSGRPLEQLLLVSKSGDPPAGDTFYIPQGNNDLVLERGGAYHSGSDAGLGCYRFRATSEQRQLDAGFRVACVL